MGSSPAGRASSSLVTHALPGGGPSWSAWHSSASASSSSRGGAASTTWSSGRASCPGDTRAPRRPFTTVSGTPAFGAGGPPLVRETARHRLEPTLQACRRAGQKPPSGADGYAPSSSRRSSRPSRMSSSVAPIFSSRCGMTVTLLPRRRAMGVSPRRPARSS